MDLNKRVLASPRYRADIDGLRALAILAVIGFHFFPDHLTGGFTGVDVFFVISGFLITHIVVNDLENNRFSFGRFYAHRVRRLFPSLVVVLLAALVMGWFILTPILYRSLGLHVMGGVSFIANFILWNENGYFDRAVETKPLLHLWTLGVEGQYYLVFPVVIFLLYKARGNIGAIITALAIVSFLVNIITIHRMPLAAFYLPYGRMWELLLGGLIANANLRRFADDHRRQNIIASIGLFLMAAGVVWLSKDNLFPGYWALLPTIGTTMIILSTENAWLNRHILANPFLTWLGRISYPLYLWHWPILFSMRYILQHEPLTIQKYAGIIVAIACSWLTYRFVELPVRFGRNRKLKMAALIVAMIVIGGMGYGIYRTDGLPSRFSPGTFYLTNDDIKTNYDYVWGEKQKISLRPFKDNGKKKVLMIGDSYSGDILNALMNSSFADKIQLSSFYVPSGCGNLPVKEDLLVHVRDLRKSLCEAEYSYKNPKFIAMIKLADVIILANAWADWELPYLKEVPPGFAAMTKAKILMAGQKQLTDVNNYDFLGLPKASCKTMVRAYASVEPSNQAIRQAAGADRYLDIQRDICEGTLECRVCDDDAKSLSIDGSHLTKAGAQFLGRRLSDDPILKQALE